MEGGFDMDMKETEAPEIFEAEGIEPRYNFFRDMINHLH